MPQPVLIVCHPGHELRVHGWLCAARPVVCVLTDGSGGGREARTESSRRVVEAAGGTVGPVFGEVPDAELYRKVLARDWPFFLTLADRLAGVIAEADVVVSDAAEGYNPGHDICRLLADTAVSLARRPVSNLAFPVTDLALPGEPAVHIRLSAETLAAKLAAAREYAEMGDEVTAAVGRFGERAFADERLYAVEPFRLPDGRPRYEAFGRDRVAAGRYGTVIRREHLEPLVTALRAHAQRGPSCDR